MARDYSNRGNQSRNNTRLSDKRVRPAKKRRAANKNTRKRKTQTPGWVWLAIGLCVGLFIAAFAYIATRPTGHPGRGNGPAEKISLQTDAEQNASKSKGDATSEKQPDTKKQHPDKPKFAFYEMLPDSTVIIPKKYYPDDYQADHDSSGVTSKTVATTTSNAPSAASDAEASSDSNTVTVTQPGPYVIQAGAFSSQASAERRKAQLTLLGLEAQVLQTQPDTGDSLFLVRTTTIQSNNKLVKYLKRLHNEDIDTLVLHPNG